MWTPAVTSSLVLTALLGLLHHPLQTSAHEHGRVHGARCGYRTPSKTDHLVTSLRIAGMNDIRRRRLQHEEVDELCDQCIGIEVRFHIILAEHNGIPFVPHPFEAADAYFNDGAPFNPDSFSSIEDMYELFQDNIEVTNEDFAGTPFFFCFNPDESKTITNTDWTQAIGDNEVDIRTALGVGTDPLVLDTVGGFLIDGDPDTFETYGR